jgi:hypothetical protein
VQGYAFEIRLARRYSHGAAKALPQSNFAPPLTVHPFLARREQLS